MAAHSRQHKIEQDQRRQGSAYLLPSTIAVGGDSSRKSGLSQRTLQQAGVERFILNDLNNCICHESTIQEVLFRAGHGRLSGSLTRPGLPLIPSLAGKLTRR